MGDSELLCCFRPHLPGISIDRLAPHQYDIDIDRCRLQSSNGSC